MPQCNIARQPGIAGPQPWMGHNPGMARKPKLGLAGRHVLLGVAGSVAAYKAAELCRLLVDAGASVQVALTPAARAFVAPLTFQALTGRPPVIDMLAGTGSPDGMDHIAAVRAADLYVLAPATASTIARVATGLATEPVSALACAAACPILVAPAMNREMWANPAVVRNVATLRGDGRLVLDAPAGDLACGEHGPGRLSEPAAILAAICGLLDGAVQVLAGRTVVITTGATVEPIDAMRVLSNRSSGKMGCALAVAARDAGAQVHLLAGQVSVPLPAGLARVERVATGQDMHAAARRACRKADCYVSAAAVADFRPRRPLAGKPARGAGGLTLELEAVPDIIADIAATPAAPYCVAFAATAGDMDLALAAARAKLKAKGVDAIVASPLAANLGGDTCELAFIAGRTTKLLGQLPKAVAADRIVGLVASRLPR